MLNGLLNLSKIVDGKTVGEHWQFYTVNVKYLQVMTHAQFCVEFPNAAREIEKASEMQKRLAALVSPTEGN